MFRKITQIFESLYWYRWRNYKENELTLPDSWNGADSLLNVMYAKLEHMLHDYAKYNNEQERYIRLGLIPKELKEKYLGWLYNKIMWHQTDPGSMTYITEKYIGNKSVDKNESDSGILYYYLKFYNAKPTFVVKKDVLIPKNELKKKNKLYKLVDGKFVEAEQYKKEVITSFFILDRDVEKVFREARLEFSSIEEAIVFNEHDIEIQPEDYKTIPAELISFITGSKIKYSQMNRFRHMLRDYMSMDPFDFDDMETYKKKKKFAGLKLYYYFDKYGDDWWM